MILLTKIIVKLNNNKQYNINDIMTIMIIIIYNNKYNKQQNNIQYKTHQNKTKYNDHYNKYYHRQFNEYHRYCNKYLNIIKIYYIII